MPASIPKILGHMNIFLRIISHMFILFGLHLNVQTWECPKTAENSNTTATTSSTSGPHTTNHTTIHVDSASPLTAPASFRPRWRRRLVHYLRICFFVFLSSMVAVSIFRFLISLVEIANMSCSLEICIKRVVFADMFIYGLVSYIYALSKWSTITPLLTDQVNEVLDLVMRTLREFDDLRRDIVCLIRRWLIGIVIFLVSGALSFCAFPYGIVTYQDGFENCTSDELYLNFSCPTVRIVDLIYDSISMLYFVPFQWVMLTFLCCLLILINVRFEALRRYTDDVAVESNIRTVLYSHAAVCGSLVGVNRKFSFLIFLWYGCEVITIIFLMRRLTAITTKEANFHFVPMIAFINMLGIFGFKSLIITSINSQVHSSIDRIRFKFITSEYDPNEESTQEKLDHQMRNRLELHMYHTRMMLNPPSITGWGFFIINRQFLLSVCGIVLTYILILHHVSLS